MKVIKTPGLLLQGDAAFENFKHLADVHMCWKKGFRPFRKFLDERYTNIRNTNRVKKSIIDFLLIILYFFCSLFVYRFFVLFQSSGCDSRTD